MSSTFKYIDVRQKKKEINFHCETWHSWPDEWRKDHMREMYEWLEQNLPHHVDPDWSSAKQGRAKNEVRRWLNNNCNDTWAYNFSGVSFASDRDAILFRMWFG
jgi:hypothetical protein